MIDFLGGFSFSNRISAAFICFTYVCLWHRMEDSSIFWCLINFIVIVIENAFINYLEQNKFLKNRIVSYLHMQL